ncbi:MAG: DUF1573 domain-containing protein [Phocaeicola sp.]
MKIGKRMLWVFVTLLSSSLQAQKEGDSSPTLLFENYKKEVGVISADDAPQPFLFSFQNQSTDTVWITEVITSCGCTTVQYPRNRFLPREHGELTLLFNPHLRSGNLLQQAFVYTNLSGSEEEAILELSGRVTPTKDPYAGFPKKIGVLRLKRETMVFKFERGATKCVETLLAINAAEEPLVIKAPDYPFLKFSTLPALTLAGEEVEIVVAVDGLKWKESMGNERSLDIPLQGVGDANAKLKIELLFSE